MNQLKKTFGREYDGWYGKFRGRCYMNDKFENHSAQKRVQREKIFGKT